MSSSEDNKKDDEMQVGLVDKQPKMEALCWEKFNAYPEFVAPLAILLHFRTGLRIGEILAIRRFDIRNGYIYVRRQQVAVFDLRETDEGLESNFKGMKFVDYPTPPTGEKCIALTPETKAIIDYIIKSNICYNGKCEDYIFDDGIIVMNETTIINTLCDICEDAGILERTPYGPWVWWQS